MMNILLEIRQDIQDLKEQMKDIDERLELVEGHCAYELLNEEEVEEMETSDTENEEENVEKLKLKSNNKEKDEKMEETINYIYETVKSLLDDNKKTQVRLIGVEKKIGTNLEQGGDKTLA
ncbi:hypothetical protein Glove_478g1 [Diversispora epigaea]|uniref:Uncharacterized protein n=1 Tax=Diversispora epigaea TaxID=1348612 RepID=A0A397GNY6_9GLOM|nr:hypothetical protein Glove_478g1 [Diversispora epigaea]